MSKEIVELDKRIGTVSVKEFKQRVELEVRKRIVVTRDIVYEEGRSAGWSEGYDEGQRDSEYESDFDAGGWE